MSTRLIKSVYYKGKEVIKVNSSLHANSAVLRCVDHMQLNHYGADMVEVFDSVNGVLHAVIKGTTKGLSIVYKREVTEGM